MHQLTISHKKRFEQQSIYSVFFKKIENLGTFKTCRDIKTAFFFLIIIFTNPPWDGCFLCAWVFGHSSKRPTLRPFTVSVAPVT